MTLNLLEVEMNICIILQLKWPHKMLSLTYLLSFYSHVTRYQGKARMQES